MNNTIWITVATYENDKSRRWMLEIVGAFKTETEAIKACLEPNYCIGPLKLGKTSPTETTEWPGAYYPLTKNEQNNTNIQRDTKNNSPKN